MKAKIDQRSWCISQSIGRGWDFNPRKVVEPTPFDSCEERVILIEEKETLCDRELHTRSREEELVEC